MTGDAYAVDVDQLKAGGVNLNQIKEVADRLKAAAAAIQALSVTAFGEPNDVIGAPAFKAVNPTQQFAEGVFSGVSDLTRGHVDQISDAGKVTTDTITSSTETAGRKA